MHGTFEVLAQRQSHDWNKIDVDKISIMSSKYLFMHYQPNTTQTAD